MCDGVCAGICTQNDPEERWVFFFQNQQYSSSGTTAAVLQVGACMRVVLSRRSKHDTSSRLMQQSYIHRQISLQAYE